MTASSRTRRCVLTLIVLVVALAWPRPSAAQPAAQTGRRPDLQGLWTNNTATPLERPKEVNGRAAFTEDEARSYLERYQLDRTIGFSRNKSFELDAAGGDLDTYEPGPLLPGRRTSMITDPPDGSVPRLTPAAQARVAARARYLETNYAANPEDLTNAERCVIVGNTFVPPLMPGFYNNTLQIVQTPDAVVLVSEQIHDARVISLTRRTHLPPTIRRWSGDSIGHWEGTTLVVDTTNFTAKTPFRGSGLNLHVIERFTHSAPDTITYAFTIDDPESFERPWSGDSAFTRTDGPMYEYACHEANYSMEYILRGARAQEQRQHALER